MMRLLLLRHAKSSWDVSGQPDFERTLAPRGRRAAQMIGEHLATHRLMPDRILCSSARRTRETLIGNGNPALRDEIAGKFPTAGLAVIDFDIHKWSELHPRTGRIVAFFRPRELEVVGGEPPSDDE